MPYSSPRHITIRESHKSHIRRYIMKNPMLGEIIFESKGKIIGQRVMSVEKWDSKT
jgi:hypothetical protein